jgi:hypothetical protein
VDAGRVFDARPTAPDFGAGGLHGGAGLGLRAILDRVFVIRLDMSLVGGTGPRIYLDAGHPF